MAASSIGAVNQLDDLDPTSRRVALAVLRQGPVSRAELGRALGLSSPSLTRLTKPLLAAGLLAEGSPVAPETTGRPSVPLDVVAAHDSFVGIKLVPGALHAVLCDLKGHTIQTRELAADLASPELAVEQLAAVVDEWSGRGRPSGIGIGLAASVDEDGMVSRVGPLGWESFDLAGLVERRCGLRCVVENDVNALTLAEHWFGFGRGCREFAVVTLGSGVGAGLVCGDELVRGHRGTAGMVGRMLLDDGRRVQDVLESRVVLRRLAGALQLEPAGLHEPGQLVDAVEDPGARVVLDDPRARVVLDDLARSVGQLVGQLQLLTGPQRVLVSGEGAALLRGREQQVHEGISLYRELEPERLRIESLGFDEWARGAAVAAISAHLAGGPAGR